MLLHALASLALLIPWLPQDPRPAPPARKEGAASRPSTTSRPASAPRRDPSPSTPSGRHPFAGPTSPGPTGPAQGGAHFALGASRQGLSFPQGNEPPGTASFAGLPEPGFVAVVERPLSTFSIDVDTASYALVRRFLSRGQLPPRGAVRIEDFLNTFRPSYPEPAEGEPVSITLEQGSCPWQPANRLVLVGLRGRGLASRVVPPCNLTFLIDVSGSMSPADRLPLVQRSLELLTRTLRPQDHVAIVVYAGASGLVLEPTSGVDQDRILTAIGRLRAGGSTNGNAGIQLAYEVARRHFDHEGINRVLLATDGDFNVGITDTEALVRLIERERESGVFLTVLGVGDDNVRDARMKALAKHGNGNYAYLDSLQEAQKVLVREATSTLVPIAKDVKIQVEFNPARVKRYRLIGYEHRRLQDRDFRDDRKDAGEIGAGHTVTALYEIEPEGTIPDGPAEPLEYAALHPPASPLLADRHAREVLTLKLRAKEPAGLTSRSFKRVLEDSTTASEHLHFASGIAAFGMLLLDSPFRGNASFGLVRELVTPRDGTLSPERGELIRLVEIAAALHGAEVRASRPAVWR